jgi:hypothetical protein
VCGSLRENAGGRHHDQGSIPASITVSAICGHSIEVGVLAHFVSRVRMSFCPVQRDPWSDRRLIEALRL